MIFEERDLSYYRPCPRPPLENHDLEADAPVRARHREKFRYSFHYPVRERIDLGRIARKGRPLPFPSYDDFRREYATSVEIHTRARTRKREREGDEQLARVRSHTRLHGLWQLDLGETISMYFSDDHLCGESLDNVWKVSYCCVYTIAGTRTLRVVGRDVSGKYDTLCTYILMSLN